MSRGLTVVVALLCARIVLAEQSPDLPKQLKDSSPTVRAKAALTLAKVNDAEAIPILIDLLAELPAAERQPIEHVLKELAGEWAPVLQSATDDAIDRSVRRDAWASWWRRNDGPALLAALAKHTLTPDKSRHLRELVTQLGNDEFSVREDASRNLRAFGRLALPRLRTASKDRDLEVARRAKMLIEQIENGPDVRLPLTALRLLAMRKPAGAVEALLAYLPFAEDEVREDEVRKSLVFLARRDGKLDAALRRGLADAQPKVRAVAAEALIEGGGSEGRAAVRKLLKKDKPPVRLRAALALARAGEREGVAVLIDLLPLISADECGQAEYALYQLAGESPPKMPEAAAADDNKKRRDVWAAWWKLNANRVNLSRMSERSLLGYTLIIDNGADRVYEIDRHGKQLWSIDNIQNPLDAVVLPGHRVLIAERNAHCVTERDIRGKILWKKEFANPTNVQRLSNGHTFIAGLNGAIVEVDRSGKEVYSISNIPGNVQGAYRLPQGGIVCLTKDGRCLLLDTTGKLLKEIASGYKHIAGSAGNIDMRPNGRLLIARTGAGNQVSELDRSGKIVREWKAKDVITATPLPNGHLLIAAGNEVGVYELDRAGNIVWQYRVVGKPSQIFRARRR
ncbi:MAG: HEAT repeat domain-containing protein [Gemmataceae bacterium]